MDLWLKGYWGEEVGNQLSPIPIKNYVRDCGPICSKRGEGGHMMSCQHQRMKGCCTKSTLIKVRETEAQKERQVFVLLLPSSLTSSF